MTLATGQDAWATTNTQIQLQENLRITLEKVAKELRESGSDGNSVMQVTIIDGGGANIPDIVRFSIPVLCAASGSIMNGSGDVANWGAPLRWGCSEQSCVNGCSTADYKFIEYKVDNNQKLLRRVLDENLTLVTSSVFANNVSNLKATLSGDQNVITLDVTLDKTSDMNRQEPVVGRVDVFLRNRG